VLACAGILQGMYASGGPLVVYVISRLNLSKSVFRSTLSATWLLLNPILTGAYIISGKLNLTSLEVSMMLLPSVVLGVAAGEFFHRRIDELPFKICVALLLLVAGIAVVVR
jgi:uncharacterized membrane protein YfcA